MTVVTLECAGVLTGEKSAEIVTHIEHIWVRGQQAVALLRQALPMEVVDLLAPLHNGGVALHKIFGVMHDTCHAANKVTILTLTHTRTLTLYLQVNLTQTLTLNNTKKVASLMVELRDVKARQYHGEDKWESMTPQSKVCFDFLCGNHTRNLPIDWFNRLYNKWLQLEIGEAMGKAKMAAGGMVRLECSGEAFLRSVCKLTHTGHAQYEKGDGNAFADFLLLNYPGVTNNCVGRADFAKRQDWSLECAFNVFPLVNPLIAYTVRALVGEANVLRDTCLLQMECQHFEAYIHAAAILWRQIFKELRGVTNSKGIPHPHRCLNPYPCSILFLIFT
jgi:hypothetical protein